jgi:hypothetical protein
LCAGEFGKKLKSSFGQQPPSPSCVSVKDSGNGARETNRQKQDRITRIRLEPVQDIGVLLQRFGVSRAVFAAFEGLAERRIYTQGHYQGAQVLLGELGSESVRRSSPGRLASNLERHRPNSHPASFLRQLIEHLFG